MTELRISDAARFLAVSDDTIRRWVSEGRLTQHKDASNRAVVEGRDLVALAQSSSAALDDPTGVVSSARNRFAGLVTAALVGFAPLALAGPANAAEPPAATVHTEPPPPAVLPLTTSPEYFDTPRDLTGCPHRTTPPSLHAPPLSLLSLSSPQGGCGR